MRAGLSPAHARDVVVIARRRAELPLATQELGRGSLSPDQVAVVAHHAPATYQESMTQFAGHATVPQLRRAVSRHAFVADSATAPGEPLDTMRAPGGEDQSASERRACARAELSMSHDRDGRFHLHYSAPATIGALVEQAVREAKDALFREVSGTSPESPDVRTAETSVQRGRHAVLPTHADALAEMAQRSLATVATTSRASHYRVYLHLSTDGSWVNGRGAIPRRLVEPFLADGIVQPVWETDGRPVSVGRDLRSLPARSRRLIEDRDRGCRFPGCVATRFVEVRHLVRWADGGRTDLDNQVSLCPFHHDAVDRGDYLISGDPTRPDGLLVVNRHGLRVEPPGHDDLAAPPGGDPPCPAGTYQPPTGERARWAEVELPPDRDLPPREWGSWLPVPVPA